MQKNVQQKKKKKNTLKNVQQKDTEKCTKKYTDKKFSRFFWSFVGSRKAEKIREKFPGEKKILEKITGFSPEKTREIYWKSYRKKNSVNFSAFFSVFSGQQQQKKRTRKIY